MSFTLSTIPLGLLALFLLYRSRGDFVSTAMFMSVFQASSFFNIGASIGVGISYLLLIAGIARMSIARISNSTVSPSRLGAIPMLIGFFSYAILSAVVNPILFEGVPFTNPRIGFAVPLHWETTHLNQLFYLALCVAIFILGSSSLSRREMQRAIDWYVAGCCLASLIAFYQFACLRVGLPFPYDYFHTNPIYGMFEAYDIGGFARINSTFTEASAAALALVPALGILAWRLLNQPSWKDGLRCLIILCALFLTISTLGYVSFGFLAILTLLIFLLQRPRNSGQNRARLVVTSLLACSLLTLVALPVARASAISLFNTVILSKSKSFSYQQRGEMDDDAWETARMTNWLGAGFGMCRGSSFIPTQFGGIGIPGMTLFAGFILSLFKPAWRSRSSDMTFLGQPLIAVSVSLFGGAVAGP